MRKLVLVVSVLVLLVAGAAMVVATDMDQTQDRLKVQDQLKPQDGSCEVDCDGPDRSRDGQAATVSADVELKLSADETPIRDRTHVDVAAPDAIGVQEKEQTQSQEQTQEQTQSQEQTQEQTQSQDRPRDGSCEDGDDPDRDRDQDQDGSMKGR